jgi:hypothetical protein
MTEKQDAQRRLGALIAWRDQQGPDSPARSLTEYDLGRIAHSEVSDAGGITRLGVVNRQLVSRYATELAAALASVAQASSGPQATPEVPDSDGPGGPSASAVGPSGTRPSEPGDDPEYPPFAAMDLTRVLDESGAGSVTPEAAAGGVRLTWTPLTATAADVIYRVVAGEKAPPPSPERGQLVAISREPHIVDTRGFTQAVRYYRVWANVGQGTAEAARAQPVLVAQGAVVSPVHDWSIIERDRHVIGRWVAPPGFAEVVVHRHAPGAPFSPGNLLPPDRQGDLQEQGFVDRKGAPGAQYEYDVFVCATVWADGAATRQFSAPITATITIPADPERVTDLHVTDRRVDDQSVFDVSWTPPSHGQVQLFLTETEPNPGLQQRPLPVDSLATTVLVEHARIQHPATRAGGTMFIDGFPWPKTWYRAYITPVTFAGGLVAVGQSRSFTRMEPVRDAAIRERVDSQVVVFDWPAGAAEVAAFKTPPGGRWSPDQSQPEAAIDRDGYDRLGGLLLDLKGIAVDIHLVPRAWDHAQLTSGTSFRVPYPGIHVLSYDVVQDYVTRRGWRRSRQEPDGPPRIVLAAQQRQDLPDGVFLTLVHNAHRLPLSPRDGTLLDTRTIPSLAGGQAIHVFNLPATPAGHVRLFAEARAVGQRIALLDPDPAKLRR